MSLPHGVLHHLLAHADAPGRPLILGPSVGTSVRVWERALPLLPAVPTVRYDLPGTGGTPTATLGDEAFESGTTQIADLAGLVLDLADALGIDRFDYAGVSLGGAIGAWLAVNHPERVASLTLICSSAYFDGPAPWRERARLVRERGTGPVADAAPARWFTAGYLDKHGPGIDEMLADLRGADPAGYAASCDALATYDLRAELGRILAPTLVIAGREDPATPPAHARELADGIAGATLLELADVSHLAVVERPREVAGALSAHLAAHRGGVHEDQATEAAARHSRHAAGTAVRRAVLGDAHVDRAKARTTEFTADFQDFITRYAWGEIWTRPGLDRRTRSAITLTALVALGHREELAMHLRGALANGLSREQIKEVLLHAAIYCGVPAANSAFATAQAVFAEIDAEADEEAEG